MRLRGYIVTEAASAHEGLAAAERDQPHCILLDLGLPDMDGTSLAQLLRDRLGPNLVLIAITGIPDRPVHDAAEAAGVDYLFQKPLDVDRLARILPPVV